MSIGTILYTILIKPLHLIFEVIYTVAYQNIQNPGLAIIALSLAINFLVLPLYMRADAIQKEERDTEAKLDKWVTHIKKTFRGDERTMLLQTYYRQNNYSPFYVLKSSVSLLLQIPFFIAAYRFLSGLEILQRASFGPISDLSKPDGLITIGAITLNLLPILMTVINLISSAIFSKDYPIKTKVQLYGLAAFFLVFLYNSPAGLVFYWTLNNLFSLIKTIFYKLKNPKLIISIISALTGCAVFYWALKVFLHGPKKKAALLVLCGLLLFAPIVIYFTHKKGKAKFELKTKKPAAKNFVLAGLFLAVLVGVLIPSAVITSSPQEFIDVNYFSHPLLYIANSFMLAFGGFVIWFGVFYWLTAPKYKPVFEGIMWALCGVAVVDYLCFGTNLGTLSSNLVFERELSYTNLQLLINLLVVLAVAAVLTVVFIKWRKIIPKVIAAALAAFMVMSVINTVQINNSVAAVDLSASQTSGEDPQFTLSKNGKNVVIIMLDRAMGEYVPYMLKEKPELKEKLSGFTYYSNTISFGGHTRFAASALFGGYEYTPVELNKRDTELLKDKHNEAMKVMPTLFDKNGYDVTVFDPPYAGYDSVPDLSIYDSYTNIKKYNTEGYFTGKQAKQYQIDQRNRNFFCYGLMKIAPLFAQNFLYGKGIYKQIASPTSQNNLSPSKSMGQNSKFLGCYSVIEKMSDMTNITDSTNGSFLMMANSITHDPMLLSEPDNYTPQNRVDNTEYDKTHADRFTVNGVTLKVETAREYASYQANMASLLRLGEWFDYLKKQGVYDNTRIILVADHGFGGEQIESLVIQPGFKEKDVYYNHADAEFYYPLLMVKDFNAKDFTTSDEFMTNADVPTLATQGVINNPVNEFTGKTISMDEKTAHDQYVIASAKYSLEQNTGTQFLPARWYSVHDSIWNKSNWKLVSNKAVITEYNN